jgi:uncharacterized protein YqfB (UPF0267 family)
MAIFPVLEIEAVVQVNDRTRINASRSVADPNEAAISKVEIQAETGGDWYDVYDATSSDNWYLDWQYASAGSKTVSCRVTTNASPTSVTATLTVKSVADDNLFSSDSDLTAWEPDILKYIRDGRSSFKDVHRESQKQILDWFDSQGIRDEDDNRYTAADVVDVQEVKEWSKFLTLQIIFEGISNAVDDVFSKKALKYEGYALRARNRSEIKLDTDGDGDAENSERTSVMTIKVGRR